MAYKRRRKFGRGRRFKKRRLVKAGFTRRVGNYGRYRGSGGSVRSAEKKYHDVVASFLIGPTGIIFQSFNTVGQSTTENGRIGRKITVRTFQLKYQLTLLPSLDINESIDDVRVIVYVDMQTNGAPALPGDILRDVNTNSFRDLQNSSRFKILHDQWVALFSPGAYFNSSGPPVVGQFLAKTVVKKVYKRCFIPIEFAGIGGTILEMRTNNIGLLCVSSGTNLVSFTGRCRIRYTDS